MEEEAPYLNLQPKTSIKPSESLHQSKVVWSMPQLTATRTRRMLVVTDIYFLSTYWQDEIALSVKSRMDNNNINNSIEFGIVSRSFEAISYLTAQLEGQPPWFQLLQLQEGLPSAMMWPEEIQNHSLTSLTDGNYI